MPGNGEEGLSWHAPLGKTKQKHDTDMKGKFPIEKFAQVRTPFYYYDTELLRRTLRVINDEARKHDGFCVHYAVKANANPKLLRLIREAGLGADCVSGGEIEAVVRAGFPASKIVYAGVGKSDWEINLGLDQDIFCFNVESIPELHVINELAAAKGKTARVAFRLNPNVGAHTHANITTGLAENKFGIAMRDMISVIEQARQMQHIKVVGITDIGMYFAARQIQGLCRITCFAGLHIAKGNALQRSTRFESAFTYVVKRFWQTN